MKVREEIEKFSDPEVRVDRGSRLGWGNPFVMRDKSNAERNRVCDAFEEMAANWPTTSPRGMARRTR